MAKVISYKFLSAEINSGTEEEPVIEQIIQNAEIICYTQAQFDANYPVAEKEAISGSIIITGEFEPMPQATEERVTELEEALTLLLEGATE
jgi:hypothetical protein